MFNFKDISGNELWINTRYLTGVGMQLIPNSDNITIGWACVDGIEQSTTINNKTAKYIKSILDSLTEF